MFLHVSLHSESLAAELALEAELFVVRQQMLLEAVVVLHWLVADVTVASSVDVSHVLVDHQQRRADKLLAAGGAHAKVLDRVNPVHLAYGNKQYFWTLSSGNPPLRQRHETPLFL